MTPLDDWDRLLCLLSGEPAAAGDLSAEDWEGVARLAQQLGVAPLLSARLACPDVASPPEDVLLRLRAAYLHTAMHNTRVYHYLGETLAALETAKVPVLLLKGAYLAKGVYGNVALRPMGDVDLMIPDGREREAARVLQGLGYEPASPIESVRRRRDNHLPAFTRPGAITLEVHHSPAFIPLPHPMSQEDLKAMWERAVSFTVEGHDVRVLAPEDQVLHLCLHAAFGHRFVVDLRPFFDVAEVIRHVGKALDWDAIVARAREWGAATAIGLTLSLARDWAGAALPPVAATLIPKEASGAGLIAYIREKVLAAPEERLTIDFCIAEGDGSVGAVWHSLRFDACYGKRGLTLMSRPFVEGLFPPAAKMARLYLGMGEGYGRLFLHYLRRFADIGWRWVQFPWRLLRKEVILRARICDEVHLRRLLQRG